MSTYAVSPDLGDCIYALPTIRSLGGGKILLGDGPGQRQPWTDERIAAIKPLLMAQRYISGVERMNGEKPTFNLLRFREMYDPKRSLAETIRMTGSPMNVVDFRKPWLEVDYAGINHRPVFARSFRYRNDEWNDIWPDMMHRYGDSARFVGTAEEHADFEKLFGRIDYAPTDDLYEVARAIAAAPIFVGNQSAPLAIAHGLGARIIVEESKSQPDCRIIREGARYIQRAKDWKISLSPTKLMIALQFHPGDAADAIELIRLIADNEPEFNKEAEFAVCVTREVSKEVIETAVALISQRFKTHVIRSTRFGRGWPMGCNDLWADSMIQLGTMHKLRNTPCQWVATIEPDCVILRPDWIKVLRAECDAAKEDGKLCFGAIISPGEEAEHINGNAIFDIEIVRKHPQLGGSGNSGWDMFHRKLLLDLGRDTNYITQRYKDRREYTEEEILGITKNGTVPAFIHGIKTASGRIAIRKALKL